MLKNFLNFLGGLTLLLCCAITSFSYDFSSFPINAVNPECVHFWVNDGRVDIISGYPGVIEVYKETSTLTWQSIGFAPIPGTPHKILTFDLDKKDSDDIIVASDKGVYALTSLDAQPIKLTDTSSIDIEVISLGNDDIPDFLLVTSSGSVVILESQGIWQYREIPVSLNVVVKEAAALPYDDCGHKKLGLWASADNKILFADIDLDTLSSPASPEEIIEKPTGATLKSLIVEDFNRGGIPDVAAINQESECVEIMYLGEDTEGTPVIYQTKYFMSGVAQNLLPSDFDFDGDIDIAVVTNFNSRGKIVFFANSGVNWGSNPFFKLPVTLQTDFAPIDAFIGDLNANGIKDFIVVTAKTIDVFSDVDISGENFLLSPPSIDLMSLNNEWKESLTLDSRNEEEGEIMTFGISYLPGMYAGYPLDLFLTITTSLYDETTGEMQEKTWYITAEGPVENEATPYISSWTPAADPESVLPIWSESLNHWMDTFGPGNFKVCAIADIQGVNTGYSASDCVEVKLESFIGGNPPTISLIKTTEIGGIDVKATIKANGAKDLPATAYLWIECYKDYPYQEQVGTDENGNPIYEDKTGKCAYVIALTPGGWETLEDYCYKEEEWRTRSKPEIPSAGVFLVEDMEEAALLNMPYSMFPSGMSCQVTAGFYVQQPGWLGYFFADSTSFVTP